MFKFRVDMRVTNYTVSDTLPILFLPFISSLSLVIVFRSNTSQKQQIYRRKKTLHTYREFRL